MAAKLVIGCGYLGRCVAALWQQKGDRVFATTRHPRRADEWCSLGWQPVVCEVLDPATLRELPPARTVVYCVGLDRNAGRSMGEVYVQGLSNVLDVWQARPEAERPGRLLYVSSTSVYGQTDGEEVAECSPTQPREDSGSIVLEAEQLLRQRWPTAVILRFAGIYGPGRLFGAQALRAGKPLVGEPDGFLNLVHRHDGAAAVLAAEERAQPGATYLISDDRPVRRREFYGWMAELLGTPPPRFQTPGSLPQANRRMNNRRAKKELGWRLRYPSFEEGLRAVFVEPPGV